MTKWELDAREAGRELRKKAPDLKDVEVDKAATEYSPLNPCRRWFQEGFYFVAADQEGGNMGKEDMNRIVDDLLHWHENAESWTVKDLEDLTFKAAELIEELAAKHAD